MSIMFTLKASDLGDFPCKIYDVVYRSLDFSPSRFFVCIVRFISISSSTARSLTKMTPTRRRHGGVSSFRAHYGEVGRACLSWLTLCSCNLSLPLYYPSRSCPMPASSHPFHRSSLAHPHIQLLSFHSPSRPLSYLSRLISTLIPTFLLCHLSFPLLSSIKLYYVLPSSYPLNPSLIFRLSSLPSRSCGAESCSQ